MASTAEAQPRRPRVYGHLMNPREHPADGRRHVRPPDWETFGGRTHFTTLRALEEKDGRLTNYAAEIEKYTRTFDLGDVLWLSYPVIFNRNFPDAVDEIKRRELYLFDIWGYVPGSGRSGYWQQYKVPEGVLPMLESKLGDHWLGMDVGEQDGRYVGGYARMLWPPEAPRFEQYLNFHRFFERMTNDLGNRMSALVSLNFGHYFLKEGLYTLLGAETAQALPNSQVYYAFIRGAGKQYGVPWFGNASVWNRWSFKSYDPPGVMDGVPHGPGKGTSLNLLKRLMYSHILYNSMLAGFESGWLKGDELTPIGRMQQAANRWVKATGMPGVMQTPVALMADFFAGWTFPRHLYTGETYKVWGNLDYAPGDYLTHGVLEMLYPGYQDSSYFHDETGFLSATPYSDGADVLLSDAPAWLLQRYPVLVVAGELNVDSELRAKLESYARGGGWLVAPGDTATKLAGVCGVAPAAGSEAVRRVCGRGWITVLPGEFGIEEAGTGAAALKSEIDKTLANPRPLLAGTRAALDEAFRSQVLFEAGDGLAVIVCRRAAGDYTVGVLNNSLRARPFKIRSRIGRIASIKEMPLDVSEKTAEGFLPDGFEGAAVGSSDGRTIAGGDVRIFRVKLAGEEQADETPHVAPPQSPRGRNLELYGARSIEDAILARPTFFQNYDGVIVDWKCLAERDAAALGREAGWVARNRLRVVVDATSGINLYPDLRLLNNVEEDYTASLKAFDDLMVKMNALGARDLIVALHRFPENNTTKEEGWAGFDATMRTLAGRAGARNISLHLRWGPRRAVATRAEADGYVRRLNVANLKVWE
jgi:hypothetical protein